MRLTVTLVVTKAATVGVISTANIGVTVGANGDTVAGLGVHKVSRELLDATDRRQVT